MNRKRTIGHIAWVTVISGCVVLTAEAKKPVKPPVGPPTPAVTPGMVLINATVDSTDSSFDGCIDANGNIVFCGHSRVYATNDNVGWKVLTGRITPDGVLDTGFGEGGINTTAVRYNSRGVSCDTQTGGKLVVAGETTKIPGTYDWLLLGYNDDGSTNKYLGDVRGKRGGIVTLDFDGEHDFVGDMAVQPNDKIVVTGLSEVGGSGFLTVARYTAGGFLDETFGAGGLVFHSFDSFPYAYGDAVANHGYGILVAGTAAGGNVPDAGVVIRMNDEGHLDPLFGDGGEIIADFPAYDTSQFEDVAVDLDGKIVVTGIAWSQASGTDILIARYDEFGAPDLTFGGGTGFVIFDFEGLAGNDIRAVAIQADGKIVVTGTSNDWTTAHQLVVRVNYDGSFDTTFAGTGWVRTEILDRSSGADVSIQDDGKIVVVGNAELAGVPNMVAVVRYNSDGSLDSSFND